MSSFLNTEQTFSSSGVSALWIDTPISFSQIRNSGGIVNVAGPIIVTNILATPASGQATATSLSGIVLAVNHATSGMFAQLSGQELFRFDGAAHSGLGPGNLTPTPVGFTQDLNFLARSGLVTLNSGTHVFDLIVLYQDKQA